MIRPAHSGDAASIADIYNYYITNTRVTFEENPITAFNIQTRIECTRSEGLPWLVAEYSGEDGTEVIGYAYASSWKGRSAYRHSVEVTVYLNHLATAKGWGTKLYQALFTELKQQSIHAAIGGITLPNEASIALHEKLGMEKVAHFKEVGFKLV
jgi:phosphinothricin acetyltransferase